MTTDRLKGKEPIRPPEPEVAIEEYRQYRTIGQYRRMLGTQTIDAASAEDMDREVVVALEAAEADGLLADLVTVQVVSDPQRHGMLRWVAVLVEWETEWKGITDA